MEKRPLGRILLGPCTLHSNYSLCSFSPSARRSLMTERSERMSEEAEKHPDGYFALSRRGRYVQAINDSLEYG